MRPSRYKRKLDKVREKIKKEKKEVKEWEKDIKKDKKGTKKWKKDIKKLKEKEQKTLVNLIRSAASKNAITKKKLDKIGVPEKHHESVRVFAQKFNGKFFFSKTRKKLMVVVKGSIIVISGVSAMQLPRIMKHFKEIQREHKQVVSRISKRLKANGKKVPIEVKQSSKYTIMEYLKKDFKHYETAIGVPKNVLSKQSWAQWGKTTGGAFVGGMLVAGAAVALFSKILRNKVRNLRIKHRLKKRK